MDKFETAPACLTQSRIEDLAGVVNLKEFEELRRRLESRQGDHHREVIHTLRKKNPSSKIIRKSGILEALRRRKDIPEGLELYNEWKRLLEKRKDSSTTDQIEVKYDNETEKIRNKSNELMLKSVSECCNSKRRTIFPKERGILLNLEKSIFRQCDNKSTKKYRRLSRKIIFALRNQTNIDEDILL
ncbi:unnamed protein product [Lepeophtheirus salmonis]|uniref:(salmon louse) hypothetical protein n=1 Tax=Lepeophtheirus salmonis TaxID=72036 RepID=A0A7R8D118_LEPSM|nr:unnamed protein product [Lepeophtheirus salmonis]CAF2965656.1 unnamed protein product [Lepeophtheirus salmonis]